jgi:anaerobic selenocysteine-containing dehydrogenase
VPWSTFPADYGRIRRHIETVVPGFDRFEDVVRDGGRFRLPHPPRDRREFRTDTGRARLTVNPVTPLEIPEGRLLLQTLRSHDQYNTTIYGLDDRYRGVAGGRRVVFCHADDLAALGVHDGDVVDLVSEWDDGVERTAPGFRVVAYPVARRTAAAYFPEANALVPLDSVAETSNTPTSKSVIVRLVARPSPVAATTPSRREGRSRTGPGQGAPVDGPGDTGGVGDVAAAHHGRVTRRRR